MELGEPFKRGMTISPGEDGTFIVQVPALGAITGAMMTKNFGFTTIDDLLIWMAKHGANARVVKLAEGDVIDYNKALGTDVQLKAQATAYEYQKSGGRCSMDALNGLKRTSAAEIIREREEKARTGKTLAERLDAMGETGEAIKRGLVAAAEMGTPKDAA